MMAQQTLNRTNNSALLKRDAAASTGSADLVWFRLGSRSVDTYGTIIEPAGVRGVVGKSFCWAHETGTPGVAIGKIAAAEQDAERLDIGVQFDDADPFAIECARKVRGGFITGASGGFAPLKWETRKVDGRDVLVYTEVNLLEASLVIAASNPDAVKLNRAARRAALRSTRSEKRMGKEEFLKLVGAEEGADREAVEAAVLKYLCETSDDADKRKAVVAAMDEHFPEPESEGEAEEVEALREALEETRSALKATREAVPAAQAAVKEAEKREAKLAADVDQWISEGRIKREARAEWITKHRAGKAAKVVRHLEPGTYTTSQSLRGGNVGTQTDLPTRAAEQAAAAQGKSAGAALIEQYAAEQRRAAGLAVVR